MKTKKITVKEAVDKARVEKSGENISLKIVADNKEPKADEVRLTDVQVYDKDVTVGQMFNFPPLWYFYFDNLPGLPTMMGEHGDTLEEAKARVLKRLSVQGVV